MFFLWGWLACQLSINWDLDLIPPNPQTGLRALKLFVIPKRSKPIGIGEKRKTDSEDSGPLHMRVHDRYVLTVCVRACQTRFTKRAAKTLFFVANVQQKDLCSLLIEVHCEKVPMEDSTSWTLDEYLPPHHLVVTISSTILLLIESLLTPWITSYSSYCSFWESCVSLFTWYILVSLRQEHKVYTFT